MRHSGALEAIDRILSRSGEADDVLQATPTARRLSAKSTEHSSSGWRC
jgi:D-arabinose 5-phosphate isomerase GutQ